MREQTGRVITVTSGKGGVGKTTLTANLGVALAALGKKVVTIDADIGLRNLDIIMGLENRIVYDLIDVIEGRCKLRQAMVKHKQYPSLYLLPAAQTRDKTALKPIQMIKLAEALKKEFDFILIDSPAGIERGFQNAIAPADEVLIVTNPEISSVRDADRVIGIIEAKSKNISAHLVLNRIKPEMIKRGEMLSADDVVEILAIKIIGIIPEDETVLIAGNTGSPGTAAKASIEFNNIARRLNGEQIPFPTFDDQPGFFQRLMRIFNSNP
ncbi:MAG: septum site-determining protein MinD [Anaerolineae bacterium]|nr:septum site-determining protein MinD [Anaerolineae bacterium]